MPKKAKQDEQSARFHTKVERMIATGELNPTEADRRLDEMVRSSEKG